MCAPEALQRTVQLEHVADGDDALRGVGARPAWTAFIVREFLLPDATQLVAREVELRTQASNQVRAERLAER